MDNEEFQKLVLNGLDKLFIDVGTLKSDVGTLKSDVGTLKSDVGTLKSDVGTLKERMASVENDLAQIKTIEIRMENEFGKKIQALFDGYSLRGNQIDQLKEHFDKKFELIADDLGILKEKFLAQDKDIQELRKRRKAR